MSRVSDLDEYEQLIKDESDGQWKRSQELKAFLTQQLDSVQQLTLKAFADKLSGVDNELAELRKENQRLKIELEQRGGEAGVKKESQAQPSATGTQPQAQGAAKNAGGVARSKNVGQLVVENVEDNETLDPSQVALPKRINDTQITAVKRGAWKGELPIGSTHVGGAWDSCDSAIEVFHGAPRIRAATVAPGDKQIIYPFLRDSDGWFQWKVADSDGTFHRTVFQSEDMWKVNCVVAENFNEKVKWDFYNVPQATSAEDIKNLSSRSCRSKSPATGGGGVAKLSSVIPTTESTGRPILPALAGANYATTQDDGSSSATDKSNKAPTYNAWFPPVKSMDGETPIRNAVFMDAHEMKERMRAEIFQKPYDVKDFYHEEGYCQRVATNTMFENFTLFVIAFNSLYIAIDADNNAATTMADAEWQFILADNFFCAFFTFEIMMRIGAFEVKRNALRDSWFVFDFVLVSMMVWETWVMTFLIAVVGGSVGVDPSKSSILRLFRLLRLTRMARMVRLLRAMPELMILIKGMVAAFRSVFFTLCLLVIILYVFGIMFRQLTEGTELGEEHFSSVTVAMNTLLMDATLPDQAAIVETVAAHHGAYHVLILLYILLASLTVMNMLVGVLVEVVSVVSSVEKEQLLLNYVKEQLMGLMTSTGIDTDGDGKIAKHEFSNLLSNPKAARALHDVGVDPVGLVDFEEFIFEGGKDELEFFEFMDVVLQFRGTNTATVKDIVDFKKMVRNENLGVVRELKNLEERQLKMMQGINNGNLLVQKVAALK